MRKTLNKGVKYVGTVRIARGKITKINIKDSDSDKPLSEIQQLLVLKKLVIDHLDDYEKNFKRS